MKIEDYYAKFRKDSECDSAKAMERELKWMLDGIMYDYAELWELRKKLFYREQQFRAMYRRNANTFNRLCPVDEVLKAYENGELSKDSPGELVKSIVANFFPQWMWKGLSFNGAVQEGWDTAAINLHFRWSVATGKKKKRTFEFMVEMRNPNRIPVDKVFDTVKAFSDMNWVRYEDFKTRMYVDCNPTDESLSRTYDWVGSGYLNDDILKAVDEWAEKNGLHPGKGGK